MAYANISNVAPKLSPAQIYGGVGLIYIRYHAQIETKSNGQKRIGGSRPVFSKITKQKDYEPGSGDYYLLLMGREFKPGRWRSCWTLTTRRTRHPRADLIVSRN